MTGSARRPDESTSGGSDAPDFLGDQPNDVALFALAHRPQAYFPLTDAEISNLRAAVEGTLPISLSGSVRELLTGNAAATEFVMSEQLLANANQKRALPARLSSTILRRSRPAAKVASTRDWQIFSWRYAGGASAVAAAAFGVVISFYGMNRSESPNFTVAALEDYEILADAGTVTRGGLSANENNRARPVLKYVEIDVGRTRLADLFDKDQRSKAREENNFLAQLATAVRQKGKPQFIFDAAIAPILTAEKDETVSLRVYDLSDPANRPLVASLHLADASDRYFVSLAP
jgi:hypothetical protein